MTDIKLNITTHREKDTSLIINTTTGPFFINFMGKYL